MISIVCLCANFAQGQTVGISYAALKPTIHSAEFNDRQFFRVNNPRGDESTLFASYHLKPGKEAQNHEWRLGLGIARTRFNYEIIQLGYNTRNQVDFKDKPSQLVHRIFQESLGFQPNVSIILNPNEHLSLIAGFTANMRLITTNYSLSDGWSNFYNGEIHSKLNVSSRPFNITPELNLGFEYHINKKHGVYIGTHLSLLSYKMNDVTLFQYVYDEHYNYQVQSKLNYVGLKISYQYHFTKQENP